ncbi:MAG: BREX-1 system adenine-specific DNA-methyltransferase PglX [Oscillospiraceae bacterium]
MNKTAIKNFAVSARIMLIDAVTQRAYEYDVTENGKNDPAQGSVNGNSLTPVEKNQRSQLIRKIRLNGFAQTMEEIAYTWFNRFIALRFMEVNNYLPSHTRVFTDENGDFKPEILSNAVNVEIDGLDREYVLELLEKQDNETLYKYLIITQCNALNAGLPEMFEEIGGWTELLFPPNLLRSDSVIANMVSMIPENDWTEQVQIIGWLYQYYNTEPKDKVFADLKKNIKISASAIPAATQLFTPDWIVRYMVDNSLGRIWLEGHENSEIKPNLQYYLDEAEQEEAVKSELEKIRSQSKNIQPEQIKFLDPCMGSGHILVYAFDVLMQIYVSCGWSERDASKSILRHNLYGLDIDRRAYQLAYFAVMMKARGYNRRILSPENQPNLANFADTMEVDASMIPAELKNFVEQFEFADTYGSLMSVTAPEGLDTAVSEFGGTFGMNQHQLDMMLKIYHILSQKYDVVCTNPPYMGGSGMNADLSNFVKNNFSDYKSDLFSAFVVRCTQLTKPNGYLGFLTPYVWMFIQSYEKLRSYIYKGKTIETLIQFEYSAFEEATVPICTFALKNSYVNKKGCYFRLTDFRGGMEVQRQKTLEAISNHHCGFYYEANSENFSKIPGMPVAYWVSDAVISNFRFSSIKDLFRVGHGVLTGHDEGFVFYWYEVANVDISFHSKSHIDMITNEFKYCPMAKGGEFRKWYGNLWLVLRFDEWGIKKMSSYPKFTMQNKDLYFKPGMTWTEITSGRLSARYLPEGCIFNHKGPSGFGKDNDYNLKLIGFMASVVSNYYEQIINPTISCSAGVVNTFPVKNIEKWSTLLVKENIDVSKQDWDAFETSWDFESHPLV